MTLLHPWTSRWWVLSTHYLLVLWGATMLHFGQKKVKGLLFTNDWLYIYWMRHSYEAFRNKGWQRILGKWKKNDPPIYPLLCHLDTVISTPQFPCDLFIWSIVRLLPVLGIFPLVCSRSMTLRLSITDLFNNQFLNSFSWLPVTYVRRTTWTSAVFGQFCASYRYKYACQGHLKLYAFKYKYTFQGYMHLYAHNCIWRHGSTAGKIPQLWGIGKRKKGILFFF